jgi:asparagine synthase (glutamine-hydrolysing)
MPEGKLQHILMMSVLHDFYDPLAAPHGPERIRPLASQPLIEACLRIPTYVLTAGGRDRAATRHAFAGEVPPAILSRRAKGGIDQLVQRLLLRNLPFVREFMLDGVLVKEKLLNRQKVERVLATQGMLGPEVGELMARHLSTEAWVRVWLDSPKDSSVFGGSPRTLHQTTA